MTMYDRDKPNDRAYPDQTAHRSINRTEEQPSSSLNPVQLDLFEVVIGGTSWVPETPHERAPSREFGSGLAIADANGIRLILRNSEVAVSPKAPDGGAS
jgi:hypothetical protein